MDNSRTEDPGDEFRPPEPHRAAEALHARSVRLAQQIGETLGQPDDPVVVDRRRRVDLNALERLIDSALDDKDEALPDTSADDDADG